MHFASGVALTNDLEVLATFPDARFNSYVQISYSSFPRSRRILGAARIKSSAPVGKPRIDLDQLREISSPNRHFVTAGSACRQRSSFEHVSLTYRPTYFHQRFQPIVVPLRGENFLSVSFFQILARRNFVMDKAAA